MGWLNVAKLEITDPVFFKTPDEFNGWLAKHHNEADFLWVGYYKKATGKQSVTWEESVDEALCYGWIDGVRKTLDRERYVIRFTPRKPKSVWSARNFERIAVLQTEGRMRPPGVAAYAHRDTHPDSGYRVSQLSNELPDELRAKFKANAAAWAFYEAQTRSYRKQTAHWVTSAKREDTRTRRLATLIDDAANGLKIKQLRG